MKLCKTFEKKTSFYGKIFVRYGKTKTAREIIVFQRFV